jgi:hypothetical protein
MPLKIADKDFVVKNGLTVLGDILTISPVVTGVTAGHDPSNQDNVGIEITANTSGSAWLDFNDASGADYVGRILYNNSDYNMYLYTNSNTTPSMTLAANGNIGVGTTTPEEKFTVYTNKNVTSGIEIFNSNTGGSAQAVARITAYGWSGLQLVQNQANGSTGVYSADNTNMYLSTNGMIRMTISNGGNVGIGTYLPTYKLDVTTGSGQFTAAINIQPSTHTTSRRAAISVGSWLLNQDTNGNGTKDFGIYDSNASATRLLIDTSGTVGILGNVGIGTYSPGVKLDVNGGSTTGSIIRAISSGNFTSIRIENTGADGRAYILEAGGTGGAYAGGGFGIYDITSSASRLAIAPNGDITIPNKLSVGNTIVATVTSPLNAITTYLNNGAHDCTGTIVVADDRVYNADFFGAWHVDHTTNVGTNYFRVGVDGHLESRGNQYLNSGAYRIQNCSSGLWQYSHDLDPDGGIKSYSMNMDGAAIAFAFSTEDNFTYGTEKFWIYSNGDVTAAGNVSAYSDIKLKTDVSTIDNALDKVSKMRGVMYTHKDTGLRGTGVIAQEIKEVLPEVVMEGETLSVAYGNIVGVLIEAIKELKAEIEQLKGK